MDTPPVLVRHGEFGPTPHRGHVNISARVSTTFVAFLASCRCPFVARSAVLAIFAGLLMLDPCLLVGRQVLVERLPDNDGKPVPQSEPAQVVLIVHASLLS